MNKSGKHSEGSNETAYVKDLEICEMLHKTDQNTKELKRSYLEDSQFMEEGMNSIISMVDKALMHSKGRQVLVQSNLLTL